MGCIVGVATLGQGTCAQKQSEAESISVNDHMCIMYVYTFISMEDTTCMISYAYYIKINVDRYINIYYDYEIG